MKIFRVKQGCWAWLHDHRNGTIKRWQVSKDLDFSENELVSDPVRYANDPESIKGLNGIQADQVRQGYSMFNPPLDSKGYFEGDITKPKYQLAVLYSRVDVIC